jgi:hypothetical protein
MLSGLRKVQGQACKKAIQQRTMMLGNWLMGPEHGEAMGMKSAGICMLENIRTKVGINLDKGRALMLLDLQRVAQSC